MRRQLVFLLSVLLVVLFFTTGATPNASVEQIIDGFNREYITASLRGDAHLAARAYADDGVFVGAHNSVVRGRTAIEELIRKGMLKARFISGACRSDSLVVAGNQAWESGSCHLVFLIHGSRTDRSGRYLTLWRQQAGGDWRIEVNVAE